MPIVKDLLNGDNIGLKESKSSNRTGQIVGYTNRVRRYISDACHDGDEDMLLNGERPRIKRDTEEGNIGQVASPGVANWETR
jgi:hypothetical protein